LKILEHFFGMIKRRLIRTKEAKREAIKGFEGFIKIEKSKTRRSKEVKGINIKLDELIKKS